MGDELGTLNDYRYLQDMATMDDTRWVHRPYRDTARLADRHDLSTGAGRIFSAIQQMIALRTRHPWFASTSLTGWHDVGNDAIIALTRGASAEVAVLVNMTAQPQTVQPTALPYPSVRRDLFTQDIFPVDTDIILAPYAYLWLSV